METQNKTQVEREKVEGEGLLEFCLNHPDLNNCYFERKGLPREQVVSLSCCEEEIRTLRSLQRINMCCEAMGDPYVLVETSSRDRQYSIDKYSGELNGLNINGFRWSTKSGDIYEGYVTGANMSKYWGGFACPVYHPLIVKYRSSYKQNQSTDLKGGEVK